MHFLFLLCCYLIHRFNLSYRWIYNINMLVIDIGMEKELPEYLQYDFGVAE